MSKLDRRNLLFLAGGAAVLAGCGTDLSETADDAVDTLDTSTLENTRLALRGFAIVSYMVGTRVVFLPGPGVRILGIVLIFGTVASKLAIEYLDDELKQRYHTEEITEEEARKIEAAGAVKFQLENGQSETVRLNPNQYESGA